MTLLLLGIAYILTFIYGYLIWGVYYNDFCFRLAYQDVVMNEYFIPTGSNSLFREIPDATSSYELLVFYTDSLLDLARKNYSGELKTKIHYLFNELDLMRIEEAAKLHLKTVLTDIQSILLYDESEYYLDHVCAKLKILKHFLTPS